MDGSPNVDAGTSTSAVVQGLTPETTYVFTFKARDFYGNNVSAPSNPITVTTGANNPDNAQAPTSPGDLTGWDMGFGEVWPF